MSKIFICLVLTGFFLSSCMDPRKNCNHPQHTQWVKEKQMKRTGLKY